MSRDVSLLCFLAIAIAGCGPEAPDTSPGQPNIVVIMTDDQRWDEVEYMPIVRRRLLAHGVDFENSFVTTSLCCPSRASFLSGQYAHHHGIITLGGAPLFDASETIAVWLRRAGYRTALIGKYLNDNGRLAPRIPPGWTTWKTFADRLESFGGGWLYYDYDLNENGTLVHYGDAAEDYSTDRLAGMAVDFIREAGAAPFFLVYTPFGPHAPPMPAPRHRGTLASVELPNRGNYFEADVRDKPRHVREYPGHDDWSEARGRWLSEATRNKRIGILESLLAVDEAVGAILDALAEAGVADRTVVLFTSDNGFMWGEHWKLGKLYAYEESIRVPLIVRDPWATAPRVESALALNIDLAPTIAELAGVSVPASVDGRSLVGILRQTRTDGREDFLIELPPDGDRHAFLGVRSQRWKYISNLGEDSFEELYDLEEDPLELDNLLYTRPQSAEVQATVTRLRRRAAELTGPPARPR